MPPFLTRAVERAKVTLSRVSIGQRVVIGLLTIGLIMGGVFFTQWVTKPTYTPLFSNLGSSDASAIVQQLTTDGVAYQLSDGGATILVPSTSVDAERLAVSAKGLPAGSNTGYTLLDQQGITTSEFQQQVTYQRAVEGELAKTLKAMNGVQDAVVHLAIPKDDVFATDAGKPTASVLLSLQPGTNLSGEQVQAVTHLVASSVQNMDASQVTVADQKGRVLSAAGDATSAGLSDTQLQAEQDTEAQLAGNAQKILDQIAGPGNAVVSVKADLNFNNTNTTSKTYNYQQGTPPLSQSSTNESYTGSGAAVGGILGATGGTSTTTNGVTSATGTGTGSPSTYSQQQSTADNAVGETTQQTTSAPGQVQRLTVSVALDSKIAQKNGLNQAQVQALIGNAVGLNTARGDAITVASMPFDQTAAKQAAADLAAQQKAAKTAQMISYAKTGGAVLLIAIIALIAWLRNRRKKEPEPVDPGPTVKELEARAELDRLNSELAALLDTTEPEITDEEVARRKRVKSDIEVMINEKPDEVAAMLRGWLAEEN